MRIVAGTLKGRTIRTPPGLDTRPTSDRARQAIFNILAHAPWSDGLGGKRVLDLFAGSGAMGLEALSRGAASCLFVEQAGPACEAIRANIEALGLDDRARLMKRDVLKLGRAAAGFDLAFLDPPYRSELGERAVRALRDDGWLAPDAVVVLETASAVSAPLLSRFETLDERQYGAARISLLRLR